MPRIGVTQRKLQTPGIAEEHKRQETPRIRVEATESSPTSRPNALTSTSGSSEGNLVDILHTQQAKALQNTQVSDRRYTLARQ